MTPSNEAQKRLPPFDPNRMSSIEEQEEGAQAYEKHLRMTKKFSERQIRDEVNRFRREFNLPTIEERNLAQKMREWISLQSGQFRNRDLIDELDIPKLKKGQVSVYLSRFEKEGLIVKERHGYGVWRRIEDKRKKINFRNSTDKITDITFPFKIEDMVEIRPSNIVTLAGSPNSGKTAFLLNVIADNMDRFNIEYYSSELGESELGMRLKKFDDIPFSDWNFEAYELQKYFADPIKGGEGNLYIIDYLEMHDEFYRISEYLSQIYDKLNGAIAIVAIQKNPGAKTGLGGYRSLEKPRLYLAMDNGLIEIVKAKNWKGPKNPNGLQIHFKLVNGC